MGNDRFANLEAEKSEFCVQLCGSLLEGLKSISIARLHTPNEGIKELCLAIVMD